jgi:hypothetical protein
MARKSSKKSGKKWIQKARQRMEEKGTVGAFTRSAKKSGQSVGAHAASVLKKGSGASALEKKRAVFARNMRKIARRRKKKK